MKDKTAETITNSLQSIVNRTNITPSLTLTDNGGEFAGEFAEYCEQNDIKEVHKLIRNFFLINNNLVWIDHLREFENIT